MGLAKVRDVMTTRGLIAVGEDDDLASAARRMRSGPCRHLPVTRDHLVIGVLSEHDLLRWKASGKSLDGPGDTVRAAMSSPAIVATPDEDLGIASARMLAARVGCLPVIRHGRLVGMLTSTDLVAGYVVRTFAPANDNVPSAGTVMTSAIFTVSPDDLLFDAVDVMAENGIRHLPVVDDARRLIGIVSERDVRTALGTDTMAVARWNHPAARNLKVRETMTEDVETVGPDQPISDVIATMVSRKIGAVPVIDGQRRPLGIISYLDVLRCLRR
jgi:acetoin utilization protein AcuB